MTSEELQQTLKELSEDLEKLPEDEESLTGEQRKQRYLLRLKKDTLMKVKEAREKGQKSEELYHLMTWGLLSSWGGKHLFLANIVRANFRWSGF